VPLDTVDADTLAGRSAADLPASGTAHRFATAGYKTVTVTADDCPVGGDGLTVDVKVDGTSRVSWSGPYGHRLDAETLRIGKVAAGVDVMVELSSAGPHDVDGIMVTFEHVDVGAAWAADPNTWVQPTDVFPPHGIVFDGTYWWTNGSASDSSSVFQYDANWQATGFSFSSQDVRGITFDGTDLWTIGSGDDARRWDTDGTLLQTIYNIDDFAIGIAFDGTDLWVVGNNSNVIRRVTTAGSVVGSFGFSGILLGLTFFNGRLFATVSGAAEVRVYETDGTLTATLDVSGIDESSEGIWVAPDGTIHISSPANGVHSNEGLLADEGLT